MADAAHYFGGDLLLAANGDLLVADSVLLSQQSILRRLLTNPLDYIWQPNYGAGLPGYIGRKLNLPEMTALITSQMYLEPSVQQAPAPQVIVTDIPNGMYAQIQYVENDSGLQVALGFDTPNTTVTVTSQ